jgi:hypothetical protein
MKINMQETSPFILTAIEINMHKFFHVLFVCVYEQHLGILMYSEMLSLIVVETLHNLIVLQVLASSFS